jgi:hypothetical protein
MPILQGQTWQQLYVYLSFHTHLSTVRRKNNRGSNQFPEKKSAFAFDPEMLPEKKSACVDPEKKTASSCLKKEVRLQNTQKKTAFYAFPLQHQKN